MPYNLNEYITGADNRGFVYRLLARLRGTVHVPVMELNATFSDAGVASAFSTNLIDGTVGAYAWTAVDGFSSFAAHVVGSAGISAGAVIIEGSNDGVNAVTVPVQEWPAMNNLVAPTNIGANASRMFVGPLLYKFLRVRISTAFVGGTVRAYVALKGTSFESLSYSAYVTGTVQNTPAMSNCYMLAALATTNLVSVKAADGRIFAISASNTGAVTRYLKLYNKASAPVLASDVPVLVIPIGAGAVVNLPMGDLGRRFTTGIAIAVVTGATDTDATVVSSVSEVKINIDYI